MPKSKSGITRPPVNASAVEMAMKAVREKGMSHSAAARKYGIARPTLVRHLKHCKEKGISVKYINNAAHKKVFTAQEVNELKQYLITSSRMMYGLNRRSFADLAYQFAKANDIVVPSTWEKNNRAGPKWLRLFFKENCDTLGLRKPQATSLGRAACFNKPVVEAFLKNLEWLIELHSFTAASIYNMDESGLSTVQNPPKVIAEKGVRQVGAIASGERGINITLISTVNAVGNSIPPILIFPRVHFKPHMIIGAPPGTVGVANQSGWSNCDIFLRYLQHFTEHARPTKDNKVLLLMDNHESHCGIEGINFAREHGIVLFTFPPHTTHKLQPLDRSVFGPLKTYYNEACTTWMRNHPGTPISIYDVASILGEAYPKAFTPSNIASGFRISGICPFNPMPFADHEFMASAPTERSLPTEEILEVISQQEMPGPSQTPTSSEKRTHLRPEDVIPLPNKAVTSQKKNRRRLGKSRVLTDTPEKNEIAERAAMKKPKDPKKQLFKKPAPKKQSLQPDQDRSSEDEESDFSFHGTESEGENMEDQGNPEEGTSSEPGDLPGMETEDSITEWDIENPDRNEGKWVLVKFKITPTIFKFYAGLVQQANPVIVTVKFLRKKRDAFVWPNVEDVYHVKPEEIVRILPIPTISRRGLHTFGVSFDGFNIY